MWQGIWNGGKIEDWGPSITILGGKMLQLCKIVDLWSTGEVDGEVDGELPTEIKACGFQIESMLNKIMQQYNLK